MSHLTYAEAMVVGLIQGVTELFPVSSLGHNVLMPALIGGSWAQDLNVSKPESPYLAFIVGLHVATAVAMIAYFWRDWARIIRGFFSSVRQRRVQTADQRLAWMIILASIPVGIAGLALEHLFRVAFSKPVPTALFLSVNGLLLLTGERLRRRRTQADVPVPTAAALPSATTAPVGPAGWQPDWQRDWQGDWQQEPNWSRADRAPDGRRAGGRHSAGYRAPDPARAPEHRDAVASDARLARLPFSRAVLIGSAQVLALLPGISRDGVVMVAGMFRGLSREDAVRFSFLLSAPVILAAGALKVPDLMGPLGNGIRGQVLAGSLLSGIGAYLSVRFLVHYFRESRPLTPFGIYCLVAGLGSLAYLTFR